MDIKDIKDVKLPRNQILWLTQTKSDVPKYIITSDTVRQRYYLYEVNDQDELKKIAINKQPIFKELK